MKKMMFLFSVFLIVIPVSFAYAEDSSDNQDEFEEIDIKNHPFTVASAQELAKAEREMNLVYGLLLGIYKDDSEYNDKEKLKLAQESWLKYRDLEVSSEICMFKAGGHPRLIAYNCHRAEITNERTARMKKTIEKIIENTKVFDPEGIHKSAQNASDKIKKWEADEQKKERIKSERRRKRMLEKQKEAEENTEK